MYAVLWLAVLVQCHAGTFSYASSKFVTSASYHYICYWSVCFCAFPSPHLLICLHLVVCFPHHSSRPPAVDSNTLSTIDPHNCDASAWKQAAFQIILMWDTDLVPTWYEYYPQLEIPHHTTTISYREKSPTPSLSVFQCLKYGGVTAHNCVQG